jgi:hypothetical protein
VNNTCDLFYTLQLTLDMVKALGTSLAVEPSQLSVQPPWCITNASSGRSSVIAKLVIAHFHGGNKQGQEEHEEGHAEEHEEERKELTVAEEPEVGDNVAKMTRRFSAVSTEEEALSTAKQELTQEGEAELDDYMGEMTRRLSLSALAANGSEHEAAEGSAPKQRGAPPQRISTELLKQLLDPGAALYRGLVSREVDGGRSLTRTRVRQWAEAMFSRPFWRREIKTETFDYKQNERFNMRFRATLMGKQASALLRDINEANAHAADVAAKASMEALASQNVANAVLAAIAAKMALGAASAAEEAMVTAAEDAEDVAEEQEWISQFACQAAKLAAMTASRAAREVFFSCNVEIIGKLALPKIAIDGVLKAQSFMRGFIARKELCMACQERGILLAMPGTIQNGPGWYLIPAGQVGFEFVKYAGSHCVQLKKGEGGEWKMGTPITRAEWSEMKQMEQQEQQLQQLQQQQPTPSRSSDNDGEVAQAHDMVSAMVSTTKYLLGYEALSKQDSVTTDGIINSFSSINDSARFDSFARVEMEAMTKRNVEDDEKLDAGIQIAVAKGVLPVLKRTPSYWAVDMADKTPDEVVEELIDLMPDYNKTPGVVVLCGLSGTGKGTTVAKLIEKLPKTLSWSNGNVCRSVAMLASLHCKQNQFGIHASEVTESVLTPENLKSWMGMLKFGRFNGKYDIQIKGLGVDTFVNKIKNTDLKGAVVTAAVPIVAKYLLGEVINFASHALNTMCYDGYSVVVEGRAQTLNHLEANRRYLLLIFAIFSFAIFSTHLQII